jgi:pimeloyl-ACP methyl ester carboxylesterase
MRQGTITLLALTLALTGCAASGHYDRFAAYVDVNGVHTYYERCGRGPPLVLLHGAAMGAEGWRSQTSALQRHFTVYVPERRRSDDVVGEWSYAGMAADTAAFMDAVKIDDAAMVGLGDGGIIALILAYSRPELVSRLVVSGANNNPAGLAAIEDELEHMTPEEFLAGVPSHDVPWLEMRRRVSPDRGQQILGAFAEVKRMRVDCEIAPSQLARISAPTLVMVGDDDMIPVSHAVEMWASVPDAKLCVVPDAGHFWLQEKPELANRIILDFLLGSDSGATFSRR